jgi:septum site-determining protein MinC
MSDSLNIAFQGTKSGLVIAIDDTLPFQAMMGELAKKLEESGEFFVNAEVTLNFGARALTEKDLKLIRQTIQEKHGLQIVGVKTTSGETAASAQLLGLPNLTSPEQKTDSGLAAGSNGKSNLNKEILPKIETTATELIRRTLRSGQIYESRNNLVILGDVNAGAEVISGGDIIVFGALRGIAHAGATGNTRAMIVAMKLRPMQLRIANRIARADGQQQARSNGPEYASIENDQIVIDKWTSVREVIRKF